MQDSNTYPIWQPAIERIVEKYNTTVVIGAVDTGKTTFCVLLANAYFAKGYKTAVIDTDVGQSEIGPPAAIGMGLVEKQIILLSDIKTHSMAFVGATTPSRKPANAIAGSMNMVTLAKHHNAEKIIIDTSGYVQGGPARYLKLSKLETIRPDAVVVLQRNKELESLLPAIKRSTLWETIVLDVPDVIKRKPQALRAERRKIKFATYFQNAQSAQISMEQVSLIGSRLGSGTPLNDKDIRVIEQYLRAGAPYAERSDGTLFILTAAPLTEKSALDIKHFFNVNYLVAVDPNLMKNLLVGLADEAMRTYALGIITDFDSVNRSFHVITPAKSLEPVKYIHMGILRVTPDGNELGNLTPWQI